jgi:hypothetical protein
MTEGEPDGAEYDEKHVDSGELKGNYGWRGVEARVRERRRARR